MKSILLTTTALVAFAGAAAADGHAGISFSGSAALGYNDADWSESTASTTSDSNDGFYSDVNLDVSMVAALDNGITVTATADIDELDNADAAFQTTLTVASENASLTYGDTDPSADKHWSGVDGSAVTGFNDRDAHLDGTSPAFDAILRGEATMGGVTASISYGVGVQDGTTDAIDAMQVAAVADLSGFTVIGAYETDGTETSMGVSASMPFGPATVGGYYTNNEIDDNKYGLSASYSDGPISVTAAFDTDDNDTTDASWEIDGSYDTGMNIVVYAGLNSGEEYYVAGTYDLGGGAELLVSYAAGDLSDDEVGANDYQEGTTVEVSFSF